MQTLVLLTNPTCVGKEMKAIEMDAIDSWKGRIHVSKLPLKENMEKACFCTFE